MIKQAIVKILLLCLIILAGCSIPISSKSTDLPDPTGIYQTVSAGLTQTSASTLIPTQTQAASFSPSPTPPTLVTRFTPSPTAEITAASKPETPSIPCLRAAAGKPYIDISVPDGTSFKPGESFTKTWRLVNFGSCPWTNEFAVAWFSGENFASTSAQRIAAQVASGQSVDISIDMTAPTAPGIHQSNWKLRNGSGTLFGLGPKGDAPFWVRIEVIDISTPAQLVALTVTPTSVISVHDVVLLVLNTTVDLDSGKLNLGSADDLGLSESEPNSIALHPLNGALLALYGDKTPSEADCAGLSLSASSIPLTVLPATPYLCYQTNQGLPGMVRVTAINENSLSIEFTTWMVP